MRRSSWQQACKALEYASDDMKDNVKVVTAAVDGKGVDEYGDGDKGSARIAFASGYASERMQKIISAAVQNASM